MANRYNKNTSKKLVIAIGIVLVIVIILILFILLISRKSQKTPEQIQEQVEAEFKEGSNNAILEKLYNMTEQERANYYCAEFFKLIDGKNYEEAYNLLYKEYRENYFPTLASFKKYFEDYFPDDFSLNYQNIERLGDIYVLWINVIDTLNGKKYGHNFDLNVVIQENDFNDYVLSFSRNSAVETNGEEE